MPDYRVQLGTKAFECGRKLLGVVPQAKSATHFTRGSHNYPRFIYHMTSGKTYYDKIRPSGKLRCPWTDKATGRSIFAIDLENFFNFWRRDKAWDGDLLQECLVDRVSKGTSDIVILRIPTTKLDKEALRIRSQYHCTGKDIGVPARLRKLFSQRKEAIEYFYQKEIPIDCFEKIGEVNLEELGTTNPSMRDLFMRLLKGTPECKGVEALLPVES